MICAGPVAVSNFDSVFAMEFIDRIQAIAKSSFRSFHFHDVWTVALIPA
jgi:hypothetical protein